MPGSPLPEDPEDPGPLAEPEQGRADFWLLIGALLLQPSPPLVEALAQAPAFAEGGARRLAAPWQALVEAARRVGPEAALLEHAALFTAVGPPPVDPRASHYRHSVEVLAQLRADLRTLGAARRDDAAVAEDHLGALCETMCLLIAGAPGRPARQSLAAQRRFFEAHLQPWAEACLEDLRRAAGASFYAVLADFALAFIDTEREAFALADPLSPETPDARLVA